MKTIKYQLIDEKRIMTGISDGPGIDGEATRQKCSDLSKALPEQEEFEQKMHEIDRNAKDALVFKKNSVNAYKNISQQIIAQIPDAVVTREYVLSRMSPLDLKRFNSDELEFNNRQEVEDVLKRNIGEICVRLHNKTMELKKQNLVYFDCRAGEMSADKEVFEEILKAYQEKSRNSQIVIDVSPDKEKHALDCHKIIDMRGSSYHEKKDDIWATETIVTLGKGVPAGAILTEDLSADQKSEVHLQSEIAAIKTMDPAQKKSAMQMKINSAMKTALKMRGESEILDDLDGLEKARDWYNSEVKQLKERYA